MRKIYLVLALISLLNITLALAADDDKFVLVIDAGHGGKDTGATRNGYIEKDINLGVALALGEMIESNMKDVKVVYTRKSDSFVDLYKRSDIANKAKANLFVSIHTNSTASKVTTAEGADTYILGLARSEENLAVAKRENSVILLEDNYNKRYEGFDPNSPESYIIFEFMTDKYMSQSLEFASSVQKGFKNISKRKDRGVRQAGFLVLRESAMPSVLIELGFINNPTEAKYLSSKTGQRSMASAIFSGLEKYIKNFQKMKGDVNIEPSAPKETVKGTSKSKVQEKEMVNNEEKSNTDTATSSIPIIAQRSTTEVIIPDTESSVVTEQSVPIVEIRKQTIKNTDATNKPVVTVTEKQETVRVNTTASENTVKTVTKTESTKPKTQEASLSKKLEYRVQILTSPSKLSPKSSQFKGLSPVKEYQDGGSYKYTYGSTESEAEALKIRNGIRSKFKDAFIVKFKGGVRIK